MIGRRGRAGTVLRDGCLVRGPSPNGSPKEQLASVAALVDEDLGQAERHEAKLRAWRHRPLHLVEPARLASVEAAYREWAAIVADRHKAMHHQHATSCGRGLEPDIARLEARFVELRRRLDVVRDLLARM